MFQQFTRGEQKIINQRWRTWFIAEHSMRQYLRQPNRVIRPHLVVGNGRHITPKRFGLPGFCRGAREITRDEHIAQPLRAITLNKTQFGSAAQRLGIDTRFFEHFSTGAGQQRFANIPLASRRVDLAHAVAGLFFYQQHALLVHQEQQCTDKFRLPSILPRRLKGWPHG